MTAQKLCTHTHIHIPHTHTQTHTCTHTHTHTHTRHTHNVHTQNYNFLPQSFAIESPFNQFALSQASIIGVFFLLSSGMITVSSKKIKQLGFAFYNFVPTPVLVDCSSNVRKA